MMKPISKDNGETMQSLATFWDSSHLPPLDQACLLSFVRHGFEVHVYSYDRIDNLHPDLRPRDAAEIVDRSYTTRFHIAGRPSLSHFSDIFRYRMFQRTDHTWIDTDLFCLQDFEIPATGHFLTRETDTSLNGAISRLDKADPRLDDLVADVETLTDTDLLWGATGPHLITKRLGDTALTSARRPTDFYPFLWNDWFLPFIPDEAQRCRETAANSLAVHLWNNVLVKAGYWKDLAPPEGSFLHDALERIDLMYLFKATLPRDVMHRVMLNHLNLESGSHLTIRALEDLGAPACGGNRAALVLGAMTRAGTPTAQQPSGTSRRTTALAPTETSLPMRTPPRILAPAPMFTRQPITGASLGADIRRFPRVTPCRTITSSPITASLWITIPPECSIVKRRPILALIPMETPNAASAKAEATRCKAPHGFRMSGVWKCVRALPAR